MAFHRNCYLLIQKNIYSTVSAEFECCPTCSVRALQKYNGNDMKTVTKSLTL